MRRCLVFLELGGMNVARLDDGVARRFLIALGSNSAELVASELEKRKLKKRGCAPLTNRNLRFLTTILGIASAMSWQDLSFENAKIELIERVAGHVDIFKFARALTDFAGIHAIYGYDTDMPVIPSWLRYAILVNGYDKNVATEIQQLDQGTLRSLLVFINEGDNVRLLDCRFSVVVARAIHESQLIPDDALFMLLAGNLCARPYRAE